MGQTTNFVTKMAYDSSGNLKYLTNPYIPNIDVGRIYEFGYRRDQFDGVREAGGVNFVPFGGTHVSYNLAGGLAELKFNNGVSTVIGTEAAQMYRPRSFTVQTAGGASVYWNSGTYQYDPSGNITAIGGQTFSYDLAGRLVNAQMLPQATAPTESTPNTVSFAYDPYGNIKTQDWSSSNPTRSAPLFMEFAARQYGPSGTVSRNRITDSDFDYDINGNLRKSNSGGLKHTMLWDARNRMTSVQTGFPGDSAGTTLEARYTYDASGYRMVTNPDSGDGKPVVSLRDGSGQLIADYVYSPASARLILEKDYLYGLGQLLVERRRTSAPPSATTQSGLSSGGNYNLALTSGSGASSYTLDVRDESGNSSSISSVTPDAQGAFSVPESSLFPDTTNLLRVKKNTGEAEPYSAPLSIAYSPGVTGQSTNTVRAIAISREGTNLVIRWTLAAADGKLTRLHFDRADGGGMVPLNQNALPASITSLTVSDQALAAPCGDFRIERIVPGQSSGTMTEFGVGMPPSSSSQNLTIGNGSGCGEDPPPPPPGGGGPAPYTLADSFHHRDHLGNLRIETDAAGLVMRDAQGATEIGRHDYYPFGTEMTEDLGVGSRKRFTGHERDEATGLDYMLARYSGPNLARFLTMDPADDARLTDPQSWNKYAYVRNSAIIASDPTGERLYFEDTDKGERQQLESIANDNLFGKNLSINPNSGETTLVPNGEIGPPTVEQAAFENTLSSAIADPSRIAIGVESNTAVPVGSFAESKIDVVDIAKFKDGPGPTAGAVLAGEVTEQYLKQAGGLSNHDTAHEMATMTIQAITGFWRGSSPNPGSVTFSGGMTGTLTTPYFGPAGQMNVTTTWLRGNLITISPARK